MEYRGVLHDVPISKTFRRIEYAFTVPNLIRSLQVIKLTKERRRCRNTDTHTHTHKSYPPEDNGIWKKFIRACISMNDMNLLRFSSFTWRIKNWYRI